MAVAKKVAKKEVKVKKIKKVAEGRGIINGHFSFNNTILNLSKENGEVLVQSSAGSVEFGNKKATGSRKSTPFMAEKVAEEIIGKAAEFGVSSIKLQVKGIGAGRDTVIRKILGAEKLKVEELIDKTPVPHGGCRPRKSPRK
ncbi:MAG: 30S ribosomal protein S11 [Spiroplasmataceae bacterium]|jgi:small subunit ribosomal protein S11|nr:30S ribosomal protein S11 [Spiroplasmataceae bacterium]